MKYYMIEFTAWTTGDRDFGFPYRTKVIGTDRGVMLKQLKDITTKVNNWKGYEPPKWFELTGDEIPLTNALSLHDFYESQKDMGDGI